jgi:hypothetical protein
MDDFVRFEGLALERTQPPTGPPNRESVSRYGDANTRLSERASGRCSGAGFSRAPASPAQPSMALSPRVIPTPPPRRSPPKRRRRSDLNGLGVAASSPVEAPRLVRFRRWRRPTPIVSVGRPSSHFSKRSSAWPAGLASSLASIVPSLSGSAFLKRTST